MTVEDATDPAAMLPPRPCGRICAVAGQGQRDLQECAATYQTLFSDGAFDPAFYSTVSLANTYCAPWLTAPQLRAANRSSLWAFAVDRLIDHVATSRAEVDDVVRRCLTVADDLPFPAEDELSCFLADVRDLVAASAGHPKLVTIWRDELVFMLDSMAREWQWKHDRDAGEAGPALADYLQNTGNFGFSFVFLCHLAATGGDITPDAAVKLRDASREAQRAMRLVNDLGTHDRDLAWGDLNVLMLGVTPDEVVRLILPQADKCMELLRPLKAGHPHLAGYVERQLEFNIGFYGVTDYVGRT
jgi:hypothetical protein